MKSRKHCLCTEAIRFHTTFYTQLVDYSTNLPEEVHALMDCCKIKVDGAHSRIYQSSVIIPLPGASFYLKFFAAFLAFLLITCIFFIAQILEPLAIYVPSSVVGAAV